MSCSRTSGDPSHTRAEKRCVHFPLLVLLIAFSADNLLAQSRLSFEYHASLPYNVPLPLSIQQTGHPDIDFTARFSSEPLVVPICWVWRLSYWSGNRCWALQALHHKLYLDSRPPEVGEFSVTHGFNLITISRGWDFDDYIVRVSAGIVLAHPENTIRGKGLAENQGLFKWGYYIAGPTADATIGKEIALPWRFYLACEAMVSLSYASVPVVDGTASFFNLVVRLNVGLGVDIVDDR